MSSLLAYLLPPVTRPRFLCQPLAFRLARYFYVLFLLDFLLNNFIFYSIHMASLGRACVQLSFDLGLVFFFISF